MPASRALFVAMICVILSMYGGGFATVPAYLADLFGTRFVGAIHGRLLTAWATAGIIGPTVVNYIREAEITAGVPRDRIYDGTLYILAGMLAAGLVANLLIRPVAARWFMPESEVAEIDRRGAEAVRAAGLVRHRPRPAGRAHAAGLGAGGAPACVGRMGHGAKSGGAAALSK